MCQNPPRQSWTRGIRKNLEYLTLLKTSPICIRKHGNVAHFVMGTAGLHLSSLTIENVLLDVLQAADRSEAGKLKRNPFSVQKQQSCITLNPNRLRGKS